MIDNSISANANNIDIISEPGPNPWLVILDDGLGMSEKELYEAMRYGSTNLLDKRSDNELCDVVEEASESTGDLKILTR